MRWLLVIAACGGPAPPPPPPLVNHTAPTPPPPPPPPHRSSTGFGSFEWGMSRDDVQSIDPSAMPFGSSLLDTPVGAMFSFEGDGLSAIEYRDHRYRDLNACGVQWKARRANYDVAFGPSVADNLVAHWTIAHAKITLACITEGGNVLLSARSVP